MKRTLYPIPILVACVLLCLVTPVAASDGVERILSFDSRIVVHEDASMLVTETIKVHCAGMEIKRGIYRDFPTRYRDRWGNRYVVGFTVLQVLRDGQPEPYHLQRLPNGERVYIGQADIYLTPGDYTYTLVYQTSRQLGFFADRDELYWNVTGNGWIFPIDAASATVVLSPGAAPGDLSLTGYTGPQGATGSDFQAAPDSHGHAAFATTRSLGPYEGLTIVVSWPKGLVRAPTGLMKAGYFIRDNLGVLLGLLGLIFVLIYYLYSWAKAGEDPAGGTIIPRYTPPEGHSPASVRYVKRMGYDHKTFAATLINMAVKGFVTIGKDRHVYSVSRSPDAGRTVLSPAEEKVADRLLAGGATIRLEQENYQTIGAAGNALKSYLKGKFEKTLFVTNRGYFAGGIALSAFFLAISYGASPVPAVIVLGSGLALAINAVFYRLLKAPTKAGRRVMDEIEGFKMYLEVAEKDRLNILNPPEETPELFEKYLPYALALDVEQRWAERFAGVLARVTEGGERYRPHWYMGNDWDVHHAGHFASSLSSSFAGAISSSSSPPGSSSGGGGGSSGGGGGGGGGGGW